MGTTFEAKPVEILLIEDNPVDIRRTKEAFTDYRIANHFHDVTDGQAGTSSTCAAIISMPRPDLILLGLNLPRSTAGRSSTR